MPPGGPPRQLKKIAFLEGDWDVVMSVKPHPDGEWVKTTGVSSFRFILDGTVLEQDYIGDMWGQSFKGRGFLCFSRFTGRWQHSWSDNIAAIISIYEGDFIGGRLIVTGEEKTPQANFFARATWFNIGEDKFDWILETSPDGDLWTPTMKAVYSKKK